MYSKQYTILFLELIFFMPAIKKKPVRKCRSSLQKSQNNQVSGPSPIKQLLVYVCYKTKYLRYLGIKIDENLNRKIHIHDLASKLNRTNAVLAKLRHFVNREFNFLFCKVLSFQRRA